MRKTRIAALLLPLLAVAARPVQAAAACATGDAKCYCQKAGGVWRSELAVGDMPVTCTFYMDFQDRERSFNVYIPPNYDGVRQQPVWAHLRGVYTAKWGGELQPQYPGQPILCRDACALWDGMAGGKREGLNPRRADNVIVVYPEAAFDDPNKRSMWSVPWWKCSMGDCVPDGVDDVAFLEKVMQSVEAKYSGAGQMFVSGNSAGGMMVYELLCESEWFARKLTAAAVFSGGMGEGYQCRGGQAANRVPLLVLHGQDDDVIGWRKGTSVDGSPFQAVVDTVKGWAARRGCGGGGEGGGEGEPLAAPFFAAQKIECRDYCGAGGNGGVGEEALALEAAPSGARLAGNAAGPAANAAKNAAKNGAANGAAAKNAGKNALSTGSGVGAEAAEALALEAALSSARLAGNAATRNSNAVAAMNAAKNGGLKNAGRKALSNAAGSRNNREAGSSASAAAAAPMRVCSVPGKKHNLYEVVRSFPIDVSAAWFAKQAGAAWGPTPPS